MISWGGGTRGDWGGLYVKKGPAQNVRLRTYFSALHRNFYLNCKLL
jgi:hypothetical protein